MMYDMPEPPISPPDPGPEWEITLTLAVHKSKFADVKDLLQRGAADLGFEDKDTGGYMEGGLHQVIVYDIRCFHERESIRDWVADHYSGLIKLAEDWDVDYSKA